MSQEGSLTRVGRSVPQCGGGRLPAGRGSQLAGQLQQVRLRGRARPGHEGRPRHRGDRSGGQQGHQYRVSHPQAGLQSPPIVNL